MQRTQETPEISSLHLDDTAEIILASRLVTLYQGEEHPLAKQLWGLVAKSISAEAVPDEQATFCGEEEVLILDSLKKRIQVEDGSWEQAEADYMLTNNSPKLRYRQLTLVA